MISIIVAASTNNVIGRAGGLPWKLSDDLRRFKRLTMGKPIVMGRRTWESIGRPLPGRQNIVLTGQAGFDAPGCDVVASPADALRAADGAEEIMIIGGSQVYAFFLTIASRIYLTRVHAEIDGDAYFPAIDDAQWRLVESEARESDDMNQFAYEVRTSERKDGS